MKHFVFQEQNIPIDINVARLLEWLISRRHCKKDWYSEAETIREKITDAIKDMPVRDDVACLLSTIGNDESLMRLCSLSLQIFTSIYIFYIYSHRHQLF